MDVGSTSQTVDLGVDILRNSFTGVGSNSTAVPFSVKLSDCNVAEIVTIKLDTATPEGTDKIAVSGGAAGVVIGIDYVGSAVVWGVDLPVIAADAAGEANFDFTAAYYQTAPLIHAGQANATATATFEIVYP